MKNYVPLNVKTHYSFLQALSKPKELVKQLAKYEIKSCAITDLDSCSGAIEFYEQCNENGIKAILGSTINISDDRTVMVIARNMNGWKEVMKMVSFGATKEQLLSSKNTIVIYDGQNLDEYKSNLGENLFYPIWNNHNNDENIENAKKLGIKLVATPSCKYVNNTKEDRDDHLLLLASHFKSTITDLSYDNSNEYVQTYDELHSIFHEDSLYNTNIISDMCESYSLFKRPDLPTYPTPNGENDSDYLRELCRIGWRKKINGKIPENKTKEYVDRIKYELDVISGANLSSYFLIVQDYVNWAISNGIGVGPGRGSGASCFISHLTNITNCDPIEHKLFFERFYNAGRNTKDKVSLPDIDVDFADKRRDEVVEYIRNKYGSDRVAQVATMGRLQGRGALKETLRVHSACSPKEMDLITKNLPDEGKISDKLEEDKETSIIRWTLKHEPKALQNWCTYDGESFSGDYAKYFEQAIRIEGTYKSYGKHASALVICGTPLVEMCPMVKEKDGNEYLIAYDYESGEKGGLAKFDILGSNMITQLSEMQQLLKYGEIRK